MRLLDCVLGYCFLVETTTTDTTGSYVTRVRGHTMFEAWEKLVSELAARPGPHQVIKVRVVSPLDRRAPHV